MKLSLGVFSVLREIALDLLISPRYAGLHAR